MNDFNLPKITVNILDTEGQFIYSIDSYFSLPRLDEVEFYDKTKVDNDHYGRVKYKVVEYSADLDYNYPEIYITVDTSKNLLDD